MSHPPAVLSVDCELFGHAPAYRDARGLDGDEGLTGRGSEAGTEGVRFLLDALADRGIRTTWFVVSALADSHPALLDRIAGAGHEVGSHARTHRLLSALPPGRRREEIRGSRERLREATDQPVRGFRAPVFDTPAGHFGTVRAAGYTYEASVVPSLPIPGWYGGETRADAPLPAAALRPGAPADLTAVPTAVMPGLRLPLSGFWLRLFGLRWARTGMRLLACRGVAPVLYVHPWELVDLPDVEGVPSRVTHRTGAWMRRAVRRLLDGPFRYTTVRTLLAEADANPRERPEPAGADR